MEGELSRASALRWLKTGLSDEAVSALSKFSLFEKLTANELSRLARYLDRRRIESGVNVFLAGDRGVTLFLLEDGTVDIVKPLPDGGESKLARLPGGTFFGEIALLSEMRRTATARSASPCTVWLLYRDDFEQLCASESGLGVKILWALAAEMGQRLSRTNEMISDLIMQKKLSVPGAQQEMPSGG